MFAQVMGESVNNFYMSCPYCILQAVRRHPGLPHCRRHGRHGQGQQDRPQDGLLVRPGGLPDVQRDVVWTAVGGSDGGTAQNEHITSCSEER